MKATASLRERLRAQLADLKMPGALEALDSILARIDGGQLGAADALEALLGAQINYLRSSGRGSEGRTTDSLARLPTRAIIALLREPAGEIARSLAERPWRGEIRASPVAGSR